MSCLKGGSTGWSWHSLCCPGEPSGHYSASLCFRVQSSYSLPRLRYCPKLSSCSWGLDCTRATTWSSQKPWSESYCLFILWSRKPRQRGSSTCPEEMKQGWSSRSLTASNILNLPHTICLRTYTETHIHSCQGQWTSVRTSSLAKRAHHHLFTLRLVMESASTKWTVTLWRKEV